MTERPNAELAYEILDHIDAHPEQWWQPSWISRPNGADCQTAGCFAGWACMLSGDDPCWEFTGDESTETVLVAVGENVESVGVRATELLSLTIDQKFDLFHEDNTREDLGRLVAEIFGPRPRHWTPDEKLPEGGTRITVKRACGGCDELLGDATEAEMERAIAGLPAEDVRLECPRCRLGGAA